MDESFGSYSERPTSAPPVMNPYISLFAYGLPPAGLNANTKTYDYSQLPLRKFSNSELSEENFRLSNSQQYNRPRAISASSLGKETSSPKALEPHDHPPFDPFYPISIFSNRPPLASSSLYSTYSHGIERNTSPAPPPIDNRSSNGRLISPWKSLGNTRGKDQIDSFEAACSSSTEDLLKAASLSHMKGELEAEDEDKLVSRTHSISISKPNTHLPRAPSISEPRVSSLFDNSVSSSLGESGSSSDSNCPLMTPCRYFVQGYCSRGKACNFLHLKPGVSNIKDETARVMLLYNRKQASFSSPSVYQNLSIQECEGHIFPLCKDQHGCRFLQKKLDEEPEIASKLIYNEVVSAFVELMIDPFGNYLCQKLIENCNTQQRLGIVRVVASEIVYISKNMHGTRAVQKLIDHINSPEEIALVSEGMKGSIVELIQDLNGNHVIQRCLQKMEPDYKQFIYDAVARHCMQVATHRHGCCVLQRCIDHASGKQKLQLINEVLENSLDLVKNPFGNYVVQYILDLQNLNIDVCSILIPKLLNDIVTLSAQKFSSNVIEKCLKMGSTKILIKICRQILKHSKVLNPNKFEKDETDPICTLLWDSYGNYVIQTILSETATRCPKEFHRMVAAIRPLLPSLRNTPYIKRIQSKIQSGQRIIQNAKGSVQIKGNKSPHNSKSIDSQK
eukprot:TRINITY_DN3649_c0_g3_i1.p1 TRINITY_DN3649_c0_g3~~TRINITY_DN3649_c0_g3_i1.p1  ORF type:complete len:675 (+),score=91.93 TRINITY_DN3649_c0_g3_i1:51-2075(+)